MTTKDVQKYKDYDDDEMIGEVDKSGEIEIKVQELTEGMELGRAAVGRMKERNKAAAAQQMELDKGKAHRHKDGSVTRYDRKEKKFIHVDKKGNTTKYTKENYIGNKRLKDKDKLLAHYYTHRTETARDEGRTEARGKSLIAKKAAERSKERSKEKKNK